MGVQPDSRFLNLIKISKKILVFTGAGISTASGIPDFRGPAGVWKKRSPIYYQEFLSSEEARIKYWEYKFESWAAYRDAEPTKVHTTIVKLEKAQKLEMVVTQNIDGLHTRAGTSEAFLVELHGTMSAVECQNCHIRDAPDPYYDYFTKYRKVPVCECGGYLKPATISFGQSLKEEDLNRAFAAAQRADLVIALGSTLSVSPASLIPLEAAEMGVPYIIINHGKTDHDKLPVVTLRLEDNVETVFPPAVDAALE